MNRLGMFKNSLFALALLGLSAPQAEAIEIFGGANPAAHLNDDVITQVRGGGRGGGGGMRHHGGAMHRGGGMHRGGMHGGMHRGGMHGMHRPGGAHGGMHRPATRPGGANVNRNINRNVNRNVNRNINRAGYRGGAVWGGRPGWYRWPAGGAIAAGAALGFVSAATAASWAGAPPQSGLCWYYTDSSRHQGFWDSCP